MEEDEVTGSLVASGFRGLHRVAFSQPFFNDFALGGKNNSLPLHKTSALAIFRHDVRPFVQYLDDAIRGGPSEVI